MPAALVEITPYDPVAGAGVTLRASTDDDARVCALNGASWWPVLLRAGQLQARNFDASFPGFAPTPTIKLVIDLSAFPDAARYSWGDRPLSLWAGEPGQAWPWAQRVQGLVAAATVKDGRLDLTVRPDDAWLDNPVLGTYAGTGGVEGPASLKGAPKPLSLGAPRFLPPQLIDTVYNVWQYHGGLAGGVVTALDRLVRYPASLGDDANLAALIAAAIPPGSFRTCNALGLIRFGAPPAGPLTLIVAGGIWDGMQPRRAGALIRRVALLAGATAGQIDAANLALLDSAAPYNLSLYVSAQVTARELIARIAASVNGLARISLLGKLEVILPEIGTPLLTLAADGSAEPQITSLELLETGAPTWKQQMAGDVCWRPHADGEYYEPPKGDTGSAGLSIAELTIFQRAASAPAAPSGGSYNFGTKVLTPPSGASSTLPAVNGNPLYQARGVASVTGVTGAATPSWGSWVLAQSDAESVDVVFKRSATQPATPAASAGVPATWYGDVNSVPAGSDPIWASYGSRSSPALNWTWQTPVKVQGQDGFDAANTGLHEDWTRYADVAAVGEAWSLTGGGVAILTSDGNMSGGVGLRLTGRIDVQSVRRVPYASEDLYRIRARFRVVTAGVGNTHYLGVYPFDATGAGIAPSDNGTYHYVGGVAASAVGWHNWEGHFRGRAAVGAGNDVGRPAPDPSNPATLANGSVNLAAIFLANYGGTGGVVDIDYITIEKVEDLTMLPSRPWVSGDLQQRGQVVSYLGRSWVARVQNTATAPPSSNVGNATWGLLSDKGGDGTPGLNSAIVTLYRRAATTPADPTGTFTYTFASGALSGGTLNGWTQAMPATDGNPLWVKQASAVASTGTDTIAAAEFAAAVKIVEDGSNGTPGLNSATVRIYQRAASAPAGPSATGTYTFASGALTGLDAGWLATVPAVNGQPLWTRQATASSASSTDTIAAGEWSASVKMAEDGATGPAGLNSAIVTLYRRAATTPADPTGTFTYTFASGALSGGTLNGWTQAMPATDGNPLWVKQASAVASTGTDTIAAAEFAAAVKLVEDGSNGAPGLNSAIVRIYQRAASAPAGPSATGTYTFSSGALTGLDAGWLATVPAVNGNPLWTRQATASSTAATDTIAAGEWSASVKMVEDGTNGLTGQSTADIFIRASTKPATPSASSGVPSDWYLDPDAIPGGVGILWKSTGTRAVGSTNFIWGGAVRVEAISVAQGRPPVPITGVGASAWVVVALGAGETAFVHAQWRANWSGGATANLALEWREFGGGTVTGFGSSDGPQGGNVGEPTFIEADGSVTNISGAGKQFEVRAVASKTGAGAASTIIADSFVRA